MRTFDIPVLVREADRTITGLEMGSGRRLRIGLHPDRVVVRRPKPLLDEVFHAATSMGLSLLSGSYRGEERVIFMSGIVDVRVCWRYLWTEVAIDTFAGRERFRVRRSDAALVQEYIARHRG